MTTAIEAFRTIKQSCEEIVNTDPHSLESMEPLDEWRQGDMRIIRLPDDFGEKHSAELKSTKAVTQLAPGTTKGSRHCLSAAEGIQFFELKNATPLDSVVVKSEKMFHITHPEHGDCVGCPPGWYSFPGQRAFAEELRRVQD